MASERVDWIRELLRNILNQSPPILGEGFTPPLPLPTALARLLVGGSDGAVPLQRGGRAARGRQGTGGKGEQRGVGAKGRAERGGRANQGLQQKAFGSYYFLNVLLFIGFVTCSLAFPMMFNMFFIDLQIDQF